jgi:hypothetical protein
MKIVVTFAVQAEFAPWRRIRDFERAGSETAFMTRTGDTEIHALITGIGARKFELPAADICLVSGVAGSLKQEHRIGDILVANAARREGNEGVLASEESLVRSAVECGATPVAFFYSAGTVVNSASEKLRLSQKADAVDMESYSIMVQAQRRRMPAVAIRAISDTADQSLPLDFNRAITADGKIDWLPALSQVAASPGSLAQLMRFGLESSRAAKKLAHFLDKYLSCLKAEADLSVVDTQMEIR